MGSPKLADSKFTTINLE